MTLKYFPIFTLLCAILGTGNVSAINETEPNGTFATANVTVEDSVITGSIGAPDLNDYFVSLPTNDGTIRLDFSHSGGNSTSDFFLYVYNKNGSLIGNKYRYNTGSGLQSDSLFIYCRAQDSIYIRISSSGSFSYSIQYTTIPSGISDIEPNNQFADAQFFSQTDTIDGRIGYTGISTDANDYFETAMPIYGTLKYYVTYNNTGNITGSDFYSYIYNKNGSLIGNSYQYNQPLGISTDSIYVHCREQDTVYIRIGSSGCFSYQIRYEVDPPSTNDIEPNNDFASAQLVSSSTPTGGRIGYTSVQTDQNDYFKAVLPTFGTFNYYVQYDNTSNYNTGSDFFTYIYNKAGSLIGNSYLYNRQLGIGYDTISIHCRELDTVYIRISSSGCFSYTFSYDVYAPTTNDIEPNDNFADAKLFLPNDTLGGRIGYQSTTTDPNDYFYSVLPEDGSIKYYVKYFNTSNSTTTSDFYTYIYNKSGSLIGNSYLYNQPLGQGQDSITVRCRAKDTVFFRISSSGCFSYKIYYEMDVPTPKDSLGNDDFANAQFVAFNDTTFGRIGYTSTSTDQNDYYATVLPDDGTLQYIVEYTNTSGSTGSDFFTYIYNKSGALIGNGYLYNQPDTTLVDTVTVYCRQADTVYIRTSSAGCFSYKFFQRVLTSGLVDVEPNDVDTLANTISLSATLNGRIGYRSNDVDVNDYFTFSLPQYSSIQAYLNFNNTSNSTGSDFFVYLYNSNGGLVYNQNFYNNPLGVTQDTLLMGCLPGDTYFLRINSSGCFSYSMDFEVENQQPVARILASQLGHEVGFQAITKVADSFSWDFGDGTTSTFQYPKKEFPIGAYDVVLSATNSACNLIDYDTVFIEVKGVEMYEPNHAGAGGDVALHIYGGGLDTNTKVLLSLGNTTLIPVEIHTNDKKNLLTAVFDLHFADAGIYDLTIEIPGEPPVSYPGGFTIDEFSYPYTAADIIGPSRWRINRDTRFILAVSNRGNVTASGVLVNLVFPKSVELNFEHNAYQPDSSATTTITTTDTTVSLPVHEIFSVYKDIAPFSPIDSFQGDVYDGYFFPIEIPHIPANTTIELPFIARTAQTGNPEFFVYTQKPNFYGSGGTPNYVDIGDNIASESLDAMDIYADNTKNVPLKAFTVATKIGKEHLALSARKLGDHFWAWYDGYEVAPETYAMRNRELTAANQYALKTATIEGAKIVAGKGQKYLNSKYGERVDFINKRFANNPNMSNELASKYITKLNNLTATNQRLNAMFKNSSDAVTLYEKLVKLESTVEDCPEFKKQVNDLIEELDKELKPREQKKKRSKTVVSMDPNAIYGPEGVDQGRWINTLDLITYMVTYENVDTASADAQVVAIYDTLNPNVFDLNSFRFGNIFIGTKSLHIPTDRKEFVYDFDMRPERNIIVRIFGKLDTISGIISWRFVSLDPSTMELPALDGFLPPNVNAPEGEGGMTYAVRMRSNVANGTQVDNTALIFFDENDPITTNTWTNGIDKGLPSSNMNATVQDLTATINFNAQDAESGVDVRYLYVQRQGETDWIPLVSTPFDTLSFYGEPGVTYNFYSVAIDRLGQREQKQPNAEATISFQFNESPFNPDFQLYPNPNGGDLNIRSNGNFAETKVNIYSVTGQHVYQTQLSFVASVDAKIQLPDIASGSYLVYFETGSGKTDVQKLLIVKRD